MDRKTFFTTIKRNLGFAGLVLSSLICKYLPLKLLYALGDNFAILGYRVAVKQRRIALDSLSIAFGKEKTPAQIRNIALDCFRYMGKGGLELIYFLENPKVLRKRVSIIGKEHLDQALAAGKGVILVSAHFGSFPVMLSKLSLEGYPVSGVMRYMRDEKAEQLFYKKRTEVGIKTIYSKPQRECTEKCLKALRKNELLFLLTDQNFGSGSGVFVDFFGTKAATAPGPVVLAMRTKAAIIPCFIVRKPDETHAIIIEREIKLEEGADYDDLLQRNVQRLTDIIERYIRKYPAEWGWIHRRWKSRPKEK